MPSNYTSNYHLSQWAKSDQVRMEDFNADNAKIDAALAALASRIEYGSYVGNGRYGPTEEYATVLQLGYRPKAVFVASEGSPRMLFFVWPSNAPIGLEYGDDIYMKGAWVDDGVKWWLGNPYNQTAVHQFNDNKVTYHYIAFR